MKYIFWTSAVKGESVHSLVREHKTAASAKPENITTHDVSQFRKLSGLRNIMGRPLKNSSFLILLFRIFAKKSINWVTRIAENFYNN